MSAFILDDETFLRFAQGRLSERENLKVAWHLAHSEEARRRLAELVPAGESILSDMGLSPASGVQRKAVVRRRPRPRHFEDEQEPGSPLLRFIRGELPHKENLKVSWRLMNSQRLREELAQLPGGQEVLDSLLAGLLPDWQRREKPATGAAKAPQPESTGSKKGG